MLKNKKRVPTVIVHDSSDSSDEEDQQHNIALPPTGFDHNSNNSACQQALKIEIDTVVKAASYSPDLDNLEYSSSESDLAELLLSSYIEDSDNESGHSNTSTISTLSSSTSSVYHSIPEDTPNLSPKVTATTTATTSNVQVASGALKHKEEETNTQNTLATRKSGDQAQQQQQQLQQQQQQDKVVLAETNPTTTTTDSNKLLIYSDEEDMDISPDISDIEDTNDLNIILNRVGITNIGDVRTISKYCILKSGRLHCHFNPSTSTNRGCQINFAKKDMLQFKTHLSAFHHIKTYDITPTIVVQPLSSSDLIGIKKAVNLLNTTTTTEDDTSSVNSSMELYGTDDLDQSTTATTEDESSILTKKRSQYDPEEVSEKGYDELTALDDNKVDDKHQENGTTPPNEPQPISSSDTNNTSQKKSLTKAQRRKNATHTSKVTPKVLRSATKRKTPEVDEKLNNKVTTAPSSSSTPARASRSTRLLDAKTLKNEAKSSTGPSSPSPPPPQKATRSKDKISKIISKKGATDLTSSSALPNYEITFVLSDESRRLIKGNAIEPAATRNNVGQSQKKQRTEHTGKLLSSPAALQFVIENEAIPPKTQKTAVVTHLPTRTEDGRSDVNDDNPLDDDSSNLNATLLSPLSNDPEFSTFPAAALMEESPTTISTDTAMESAAKVMPTTTTPSSALLTNIATTSTTPLFTGVSTVNNSSSNQNIDEMVPGTEAINMIPAIPSDGLWPFQLGFGFFIKSKYYCNVTRSLGPQKSCKATFLNRSVFIQHLNYAHHLNEKNALTFRESEEDDNLEKYVVDLMIAANLPSTVVNNKKFVEMVKAIRGPSDIPVIIPSLDRVRHSIQDEYDACHLRIKELLKSQESVSFSVHTWKPAKGVGVSDSAILIVTAFFIDNNTWSLKDVMIGFKTIKDEGGDRIVKSSFDEVLKSFDIVEMEYTITCPDLNHAAPIEEQLENGLISGIDTSVQLLCLDQIIDTIKKRLFKHIKQDFVPLKKVLEAISNFKDLPGPLAKSFTTILNKDDTSYYLLSEVTPIFSQYNDLCQSYPDFNKFGLDAQDQLKIREILYLISTINQSIDWLMNSTNYRYPTANKVYIICMELLDSIYRVAKCYGCQTRNDMLGSKDGNNHDQSDNDNTTMKIALNKMYAIIHTYMKAVQKVKQNFIWTSLVLDTFSFTAFQRQEFKYFASDLMNQHSVSLAAAARPPTDELMKSIMKSQAVAIEKILNGSVSPAVEWASNISPTGLPITREAPKSTNKRQSIFSSIGLTIAEEGASEAEDYIDNLRKKRRLDNESGSQQVEKSHQQSNTSATLSPYQPQSFDMYISQFKADQKVLLVCNPSHTARSARADSSSASSTKSNNKKNKSENNDNTDTKNVALSSILCNEQNNFAQLTFWNSKKSQETYYPRLRKLTKESFAVPTTSKESLRIAEEAKKHYIGLSCLHSDTSCQENQMRTLLYVWRKDNTVN